MALNGKERLYVSEGVGRASVSVDEIAGYVGGSSGDVTASQISDSTATGRAVLTAEDAAAARAAIGAGTSSLAIGTTSSTAKAGDYAPPAGSAAMLTTGTDTTQRTWTAADIAAFVAAQISAAAG